MMSNYTLFTHAIYHQRIVAMTDRVRTLKETLSDDDFARHPLVKFLARIRKADSEIIPRNPDLPEYRLSGELKGFRRYKRGLQRYRLFYCFSFKPPLIVYLFLNDAGTLRKEGDKNDPYVLFLKEVQKGTFAPNPSDPKMKKFISKLR